MAFSCNEGYIKESHKFGKKIKHNLHTTESFRW